MFRKKRGLWLYNFKSSTKKKSSCFSDLFQFFLVGMLSGYHFSMGGIQRLIMVYKRFRSWTLGRVLPPCKQRLFPCVSQRCTAILFAVLATRVLFWLFLCQRKETSKTKRELPKPRREWQYNAEKHKGKASVSRVPLQGISVLVCSCAERN